MQSIEGAAGMTGFRRYTWWALPGATAVYLVMFSVESVVDPDLPAWGRVGSAAALAVTVVASVVLLSRRLDLLPASEAARLPVGWLCAGSVGAGVLGTVQLASGEYGLWAVAPAIMVSIAATYLRSRQRWMLLAGAVVVAPVPGLAVSLASGDGDLLFAALFPIGLVAFIAWVTLGPLWAWDIAGQLDEARRMSAELAVKDERLRFAADLHDIQGHHLQVIALKSELATRLAEADPARAAAEMKEVQRMAVDALQDTRAVVQGYRRTSLDAELANATKVLAAADIDARTSVDPGVDSEGIAEATRHLLGLVMREATTNVLRHSRAEHAEVVYGVADGVAYLRIGNDGAGARPAASDGTGLRALAERLRAAGGELTWEHERGRFDLAARLPAGAGEKVR
ncbi:MAG: sensor histidine kinase [Nocardioidaceae bacterium]